MRSYGIGIVGIAVLVVAGCSDGSAGGPSPLPDFALQDVNPNSATYLETVSPRDHVRHATAWYFGAST
jgi:hypothetical protein